MRPHHWLVKHPRLGQQEIVTAREGGQGNKSSGTLTQRCPLPHLVKRHEYADRRAIIKLIVTGDRKQLLPIGSHEGIAIVTARAVASRVMTGNPQGVAPGVGSMSAPTVGVEVQRCGTLELPPHRRAPGTLAAQLDELARRHTRLVPEAAVCGPMDSVMGPWLHEALPGLEFIAHARLRATRLISRARHRSR